jgi:hypothetical protein
MTDRKDYRFSFGSNALTGRYFHPEKTTGRMLYRG